jgi:hypothetical protein
MHLEQLSFNFGVRPALELGISSAVVVSTIRQNVSVLKATIGKT